MWTKYKEETKKIGQVYMIKEIKNYKHVTKPKKKWKTADCTQEHSLHHDEQPEKPDPWAQCYHLHRQGPAFLTPWHNPKAQNTK